MRRPRLLLASACASLVSLALGCTDEAPDDSRELGVDADGARADGNPTVRVTLARDSEPARFHFDCDTSVNKSRLCLIRLTPHYDPLYLESVGAAWFAANPEDIGNHRFTEFTIAFTDAEGGPLLHNGEAIAPFTSDGLARRPLPGALPAVVPWAPTKPYDVVIATGRRVDLEVSFDPQAIPGAAEDRLGRLDLEVLW
jgi:hypothetical protein